MLRSVATPIAGGTMPITYQGRATACQRASFDRAGVGGTIGKPSVQP